MNGWTWLLRYRPEIDGLRALSVLAVMFFHFEPASMPGGFVGVDVFFVISGYLITLILADGGTGRRLGFADFYVRRIRRLAPALLVMLVLTIGAGWLILAPGDYASLATSALYALIGASNVFFLYNTGYFDASAHSMPLLHTWSLAVEEQFYLVWPLALWLLRKACGERWRPLLAAVVVLMLVSFGLNLHAVATAGKSAFYLPHDRAWELLVGCALALARIGPGIRLPGVLAAALPPLGIAAICYAATEFTAGDVYPGFRALLPVLGAAAFLLPVGQGTLAYRLFAARLPVVIGQASYSIYLYHWPVLVLWLHYTAFEPITPGASVWLILASCALGVLSSRFVEAPFRRARTSKRRIVAGFVAAQLAVAAVCVMVSARAGVPERIPDAVHAMGSLDLMWHWTCPRPQPVRNVQCEAGRPWAGAAHRILLVGDSNAGHFLPLLALAAEGRDVSVRMVGMCSPAVDGVTVRYYTPNEPEHNDRCRTVRASWRAYAQTAQNASLVVVASAWSSAADQMAVRGNEAASPQEGLRLLKSGLDDFLAETTTLLPHRKIVLIAEVPRWEHDPMPCVLSQQTTLLRRRCPTDMTRIAMAQVDKLQKPTRELLRQYDGKDGMTVISPTARLCDATGCRTTIDGEFIYRDQGHLRRNLTPEIARRLTEILGFPDVITMAERAAASR